jgi:hypothetical protein
MLKLFPLIIKYCVFTIKHYFSHTILYQGYSLASQCVENESEQFCLAENPPYSKE